MSEYVRRGKRIADLISYAGEYLIVETKDRRRVRWAFDKPMQLIEFGSLNPANPNYVEGGKVIREFAVKAAP